MTVSSAVRGGLGFLSVSAKFFPFENLGERFGLDPPPTANAAGKSSPESLAPTDYRRLVYGGDFRRFGRRQPFADDRRFNPLTTHSKSINFGPNNHLSEHSPKCSV